jgi:hypothetical protein
MSWTSRAFWKEHAMPATRNPGFKPARLPETLSATSLAEAKIIPTSAPPAPGRRQRIALALFSTALAMAAVALSIMVLSRAGTRLPVNPALPAPQAHQGLLIETPAQLEPAIKNPDPRVNAPVDFVLQPAGAPITIAPVQVVPLPADAAETLAAFQAERAKALEEMEAKLAPRRDQLISQLQALQDKYTRAAKLDEAVAIRDTIRNLVAETGGSLEHPIPAPENLTGFRDRVGKSLFFKVPGASGGTIWGSGIYTDDSSLATAAVHAGILQPGQSAVLKATILPGQKHYDADMKNNVLSQEYNKFEGSFKLELAPGAKIESPQP